ncbi:RNA polymerase sigma-70 factor, ECF subfamily [Rubritalea squalenifaciens DSM 18772]|uniref:RNA polymerase sigma-70 factor, ECF subfamily n=1 Tax=Rubritalea squalenifaciens DSM 18772 TaxID=1123071 RepID=A0A1M6NV08_9BACT|nr:sigma-70 family RNA polymerase sigma factor [Rubritalea squalenifaciens]SHJ99520.1 RNA polymerase sigma-70 factor, ECF subfamily [Rubritalea squalenifaciens DSM 18772]
MSQGNHRDSKYSSASELKYDRLVADHQEKLYYFIRSMVFNPEDARDVLQDVNMVLFRKRAYYVQGTNFKAWAFTVARFECLNYLKQYKKVKWDALESALIENIADHAETKADDMEHYLRALEDCLPHLPEEARSLVDARYQERRSLQDVAEDWSTTVGALKQKLFRARANLKKCISGRIHELLKKGEDLGGTK